MRKILLFAAALLTVTAVNAKVWRINYNDNAKADFKTIAACLEYKDFTDGDTLYMDAGFHNGSQSDNTISKSCTILGPGWGFQTSANTVSETESAVISSTLFLEGENISVKLSGLYCEWISCYYYSTLNDLIIEKCRLTSTSSSNSGMRAFKANNIEVKNCFIEGDLTIDGAVNASIVGNIIRALSLCTPSNRCIVDHNTIIGYFTNSGNLKYYTIGNMNNKVSLTNNIIINSYNSARVIYDLSSTYPMYNNVFSITPETVQSAENRGETTYDIIKDNNQLVGATKENTFVCALDEGIVDNAMYYQVKDSAVAKTADSNGGECGAFGGDFPYQLNGRPDGIPYLYDINVPKHTTNNQLSISFKVAGNNE